MRIFIHALICAVCAAVLYWLSPELGFSLYKRSSAVDSEQGPFELSQMFVWSGVGAVVGALSGYRQQKKKSDDV